MPCPEPDTPVFCSKPWTSFEVEHDGTVTPCCMARFPCGNVGQQSVEEIWNGEAYQEFRRCMASGEREKICRPECPRLRDSIDDSVSDAHNAAFIENYETNLEEIEQRATVLKSFPRIWKTTGSTLCNLDCIMCYQDRNDRRALPASFFKDLEPLFVTMQEVQIIGGEPFAIRRLRKFMRNFPRDRYPDARFAIVSNGTLHDDKTLQIVRDLRVSWMSISVDAASDATYARIRRGGDLETTLRGVRRWIDVGRDGGFPVHMAFTVMRDNVDEMPQFAQLAHELGADVLFGKVFGMKADQHLIDPQALRLATKKTGDFVESVRSQMPLARLTLSSIA